MVAAKNILFFEKSMTNKHICQHLQSRYTNILYFENAIFVPLTNSILCQAVNCARELFRSSKDSASLHVCNEKSSRVWFFLWVTS